MALLAMLAKHLTSTRHGARRRRLCNDIARMEAYRLLHAALNQCVDELEMRTYCGSVIPACLQHHSGRQYSGQSGQA